MCAQGVSTGWNVNVRGVTSITFSDKQTIMEHLAISLLSLYGRRIMNDFIVDFTWIFWSAFKIIAIHMLFLLIESIFINSS